MDDLSKKVCKITVLVVSAVFICLQSFEMMVVYVADIMAGIIKDNPEVSVSVAENYKRAFDIFLPIYIFRSVLLIIALIGLPLCLKYKDSIVSKVLILFAIALSFADMMYLFVTGTDLLLGYVSIYLFIYSCILCKFIFSKKTKEKSI